MALSGWSYESRAELIDQAVVEVAKPEIRSLEKAQTYALIAIAQCLNEMTQMQKP